MSAELRRERTRRWKARQREAGIQYWDNTWRNLESRFETVKQKFSALPPDLQTQFLEWVSKRTSP